MSIDTHVLIRQIGRPTGMALTEYVLATTALASAWLILDGSPMSLGRALVDLMAAYSFSLSLPW